MSFADGPDPAESQADRYIPGFKDTLVALGILSRLSKAPSVPLEGSHHQFSR